MNDWNPKLPALIGTLAELKDYEKPAVEAYGRACARAGRDAALSAAPKAAQVEEVVRPDCEICDNRREVRVFPANYPETGTMMPCPTCRTPTQQPSTGEAA